MLEPHHGVIEAIAPPEEILINSECRSPEDTKGPRLIRVFLQRPAKLLGLCASHHVLRILPTLTQAGGKVQLAPRLKSFREPEPIGGL